MIFIPAQIKFFRHPQGKKTLVSIFFQQICELLKDPEKMINLITFQNLL